VAPAVQAADAELVVVALVQRSPCR